MATISVSNEMFTTTSTRHLNDVIQNFKHIPQPFAEDALKLGKKVNNGGQVIILPYEMADHSLPTRVTFNTAFAKYGTFAQSTITPGMLQTWGYVVQPAFISGMESDYNRGEAQQIDIAKRRVENVYNHLLRQMQSALLLGPTATGSYLGTPGWDDFFTVNGTDFSNGFIEEDASGGNTIHGVSRASFPATTHPRFHNLAFDVANAASTGLLDKFLSAGTRMRLRGLQYSKGYRGYCSEAFEANLARISRSYVMTSSTADVGKLTESPTSIVLGKPCTSLAELPNAGANSATYKWSYVGIDWGEGISLEVQAGKDLKMDPWQDVPGTVGVRGCLFHLHAQLALRDPGRQVLIHRAETYA